MPQKWRLFALLHVWPQARAKLLAKAPPQSPGGKGLSMKKPVHPGSVSVSGGPQEATGLPSQCPADGVLSVGLRPNHQAQEGFEDHLVMSHFCLAHSPERGRPLSDDTQHVSSRGIAGPDVLRPSPDPAPQVQLDGDTRWRERSRIWSNAFPSPACAPFPGL